MFGAFLSWTVSAANVVVGHTTSAIMFVRDFLADQPVDGEIDQPTIVETQVHRQVEVNEVDPQGEPRVNEGDPQSEPQVDEPTVDQAASALEGVVKSFIVKVDPPAGPATFLKVVKPKVLSEIFSRETKIYMSLKCVMGKLNPADNVEVTDETHFRSKCQVLLDEMEYGELYDKISETLLESFAKYQKNGSGWRLKSVEHLDVRVFKYKPLKGSSYIPLPKKLKNKKAIINIANKDDDECFKWAVARALNMVEDHPERVTKTLREQSEQYNWQDISFPTTLENIKKFDTNNNMLINVFGFDEEKNCVYPLRVPKGDCKERVLLMLIKDGVDDNLKSHYTVVKCMSRLLYTQATKKKCKRFYCNNCLNGFTSETTLEEHTTYCGVNECVRSQYPAKGKNILRFKNYERSVRHPFVIYADFECFTTPLDIAYNSPETKYTTKYQKHEPSGFCYYVKCSEDNVYDKEPVMYTKENEHDDVPKKFVESLEDTLKEIVKLYDNPKKMVYGKEERRAYGNATRCYVCRRSFVTQEGKLDKVRDHCHLTGRYRGAAHNKCNLAIRNPKFVPVVFHNLEGYDSHLFIKNLGVTKGEVNCIPKTDEKYISFTKSVVVGKYIDEKDGEEKPRKAQLRFIDSFKFMSAGLGNLVSNLDEGKFKNTSKFYSGDYLSLLLRKGVYSYDYMSGLSKFNETKLPSIHEFYSKLNDSNISDEDYTHAQNVWRVFDCKNLKDYHDLYLRSDVLLLADIFESFRDLCMENYKLDPAHYYTSPGLAWDAALYKTGVKLELLTDPNMYLMIENGIRGGISMITHRHWKANNKYMKDYNPEQPGKYITYLDANNLYGYAMVKKLPTCNFKWMDDSELESWTTKPCILEVDLEYPEHLHDLHNEYPLAPERLEICKVEKLVPNLNNKTKYVVHHETLKLYLSLGLKITNIHKGITFHESAWLARYINMNTNLRTLAKSDFEKDFFKLMNNSVFGKTMENIRNRVDVRLVNDAEKAMKLAAKPNFHAVSIFSESLVAINMKKTKQMFNKPIYLGMSILDLSKNLMYEFHHNYIKPKYGDDVKLLFTDTDSLCYEIKTEDFYRDITPDVHRMFDTSNYSKDHRSKIPTGVNKKVIGMFKDECGGKQILEFVGLRPKLYSYKVENTEEQKKCKGVKKSVVKKDISLANYRECLFSGEKQLRKMNVIRSEKHEIHSEQVNKVALNCEDDKRVILDDKVSTLAIGHYTLKRKESI